MGTDLYSHIDGDFVIVVAVLGTYPSTEGDLLKGDQSGRAELPWTT